MKYRIIAIISVLAVISLIVVSAVGEPNPYLRNFFSTVDELKEWVNTPYEEQDKMYSSDKFKDAIEYIKNNGVPVPKIKGPAGENVSLTNISVYKELYSVNKSCGIDYSMLSSGEVSFNISINIEIIPEESKASAQSGVLEYLKKSGIIQKFYENKTAVFNRYGCSVSCRIMQDKVEQFSIGGQERDVLIRTYETGWGEPDGNRIIFIYNDFCVTIYNLDDLNILNEFSIEVEPL